MAGKLTAGLIAPTSGLSCYLPLCHLVTQRGCNRGAAGGTSAGHGTTPIAAPITEGDILELLDPIPSRHEHGRPNSEPFRAGFRS